MQGRDDFQQIDHHSHRQHARSEHGEILMPPT